ncbi:MAG: hypothetical protein KC912_17065 [Proteobacteria bacterium]|nr:hypothetical protein [Pseudomonadota bacterium]
MRVLTLATTLAMLAACDGGLQFSHTSTLNQDTRGVALNDSDDARVGMSGTTCDVDTDYGSIGTDYDYPGSEDTIQDSTPEKVVVTSGNGLHIQDRGPGMGDGREDYDLPTAEYSEGVLIEDGAVVLGHTPSGCHVSWRGPELDNTVHLKPDVCASGPALEADPVLGTAWVGTADGIYTAPPEADAGVSTITETPADLLAFDDSTGFMYAALKGSNEVRALDLDGNEVWVTDVMAQVTDLEDFGSRSSALVSVTHDDGSGSVLVLDGLTGQITSEMGTPDGNQRIASSAGGGQMALVRDNEVHFYQAHNGFNMDFGDIVEIADGLE